MEYFDLKEISGSERSTLYRALRRDGKTVLLKMAGKGEINKVMLRREYEISKSLSHPGLPYVISYETDSLAGEFIVMEYVDGRTLDKFLESGPSLELRRNVFFQLLDVISYIHKCGIVHNDLKPQNIMVSNSSDSVKLIDFGMSADDSRFLAETAKGTPGYASPELFAGGPVDKRSDIWSIGAIMRDMFGTRYSRVSEKCLDLDPDGRYPSVGELKKAMGAQRSRTVMLVALPFILLILSISAFFLLRGRPDYDPPIGQAAVQVRQDLQVASGGEQEPSASPEVTATIPESSLAGDSTEPAPISLPVRTGIVRTDDVVTVRSAAASDHSINLSADFFGVEDGDVSNLGFLVADSEDILDSGSALVIPASGVDGSGNVCITVDGLDYDRRYCACAFVKDGKTVRRSGAIHFVTLPKVETLDVDASVLKAPVFRGRALFHERVSLPSEVLFRFGPVGRDPVYAGHMVTASMDEDGLFTAVADNNVYCDLEYQFLACAVFDGREITGQSGRFHYDTPDGMVDLGLNVLWAEKNLGASTPADAGDHYCWGETEPHYTVIRSVSDFDWKVGKEGWHPCTYKFFISGEDGSGTCYYSKYNEQDGKTALELEDDAVYVALGGRWKTPSHYDWTELRRKTKLSEWTDGRGLAGFKAESLNPELKGRVVYFPMPTYAYQEHIVISGQHHGYLSSSLIHITNGSKVPYSGAYKETDSAWGYGARYIGRLVRPVWDWKADALPLTAR